MGEILDLLQQNDDYSWNLNFFEAFLHSFEFTIVALRFRHVEINTSFNARTVQLGKTKAIAHLLTYATTFSGWHLMSRTVKAWKLKRALLQNEEPSRANTLWNTKFLKGLISDKTSTFEEKVI